MTLTFDRPGALERPSHDWTRDDAGRPWVLPDPDWSPEHTQQWLAGRARDGRVPYTRVTTFVEALLEGTALGRWKMRRVALGMGRRPDYVVAAAALTAEDRDKAALNDLAEKALEAAGPNAADIGTALHQFTERIDRGEPMGFVPEQYAADLDAYREQVQRITWLHREERMICDLLETAGTPDGIGLVDEPDPDGVIGVPRIIDLKTGNVEYTAGKFSAQLGVYANSVLYDARDGTRTPVPDLDTRWGLVLHMPAGLGTAQLRWLNIQHGWLGAQLCGPVRKWRTIGHGDLMRPLVAPEPRQVPDGKCGGRKRDGEPCTYRAVAGGFCGRHQDQVGTDPDAPVNARTTAVAGELQQALADVPEPLRIDQPATVVLEDDALLDRLDQEEHPEPAPQPVEKPVEEFTGVTSAGRAAVAAGPHWFVSATGDSFGLCLNCGIPRKHPDAQHLGYQPDDIPADIPEQRVEQNGNPRPHSSIPTPDNAAAAGRRAEDALLEQVRACRTTGELQVLWERTGQAWTVAVKAAASEQRQALPELARRERVDAALLAAIAACRSQPELRRLGELHSVGEWTDEAKAAARKAAAELPPF
jgi:hypothetical protein